MRLVGIGDLKKKKVILLTDAINTGNKCRKVISFLMSEKACICGVYSFLSVAKTIKDLQGEYGGNGCVNFKSRFKVKRELYYSLFDNRLNPFFQSQSLPLDNEKVYMMCDIVPRMEKDEVKELISTYLKDVSCKEGITENRLSQYVPEGVFRFNVNIEEEEFPFIIPQYNKLRKLLPTLNVDSMWITFYMDNSSPSCTKLAVEPILFINMGIIEVGNGKLKKEGIIRRCVVDNHYFRGIDDSDKRHYFCPYCLGNFFEKNILTQFEQKFRKILKQRGGNLSANICESFK